MRGRSGKRKCTKKSPCSKPSITESLDSKSTLPGHLHNYNDIMIQLINRKAHYLSPNGNNSSYEEWAKTQNQEERAPCRALEDILKVRTTLTEENLLRNLNWETLDVIKYLVSSQSEVPAPKSVDWTQKEHSANSQNPIVLRASISKVTSKGSTVKLPPQKPSTVPSSDKLREPVYPKKYQPTYKLSNYDYVKRGWTKLPDYSITYRCYTLGSEPAFPALWAFRAPTDGCKRFYPNTKTVFADFEGEKPHFVYYKNGEVAISISEGRVGPRMIVYSMSKKDGFGRWIESKPQAMFDSKGNGVVYDVEGKMRANYDQIEGAMYYYGRNAKPALHWYWKESTFLRMRRDDLNGVPPDRNDDIDPTKPDGESRKSRASKRSSKKKSRNSGKRKSQSPRKSKAGPRKSKAGPRKSKTGARKSKVVQKKNVSQKNNNKTPEEDAPRRKSAASGGKKNRSRRKSMKKGAGTNKNTSRVDVPPLRKKPRHPKPITEVAPLAIKITDYVSMRIMNQQHIHLDFECGKVHCRFYLGVNVKPEIVERIDRIVNPKRADHVTPCYFELMPLRSKSLYFVNKKIQEMRKEAARREYKKDIRSIAGFYAWWLKNKRAALEKRTDKRAQLILMTDTNKKL